MNQFANCLMMLGKGGDRQLTERWISAPSDYAPKVDVSEVDAEVSCGSNPE